MINIARRKLPPVVMGIFVYISYCAMSWFVMRGTMAYYGEQYNWAAWFANDVFSFFIGGIVPLLLYEFLAWFALRMITAKIGRAGDIASVRYGLDFAVIAANVVLFALKFIYLAAPLYASMLNIILDPIVTIAFVALYLWYAYKQNYVDKSAYRIVVSQVMGIYLTVFGVLALINILVTVM